MTEPGDRSADAPAPGPGQADARTTTDARTTWVRDSVGPQLRLAAKSARMLLDRRLGRAGASFGNWTVLATLEGGGPMIQRILAESLSIEGPTLTRHLERLEELGLVRRDRSGADRRYALVELTTAGRALCHELDAVAREANDQLLAGFSGEEIAQLKIMLKKLTRNAAE